MNTPIKYFGGKNLCFNNIEQYFPDKDTYDTYIEPFGGSYGIGLHMKYVPPTEIYNDLEKNVYSLYKVLQDSELFDKFKEKCDLSPYCDDLRKEFKERLRSENLSMVDRAYMFFYVNRTSHNGIGGFSINSIIRRKTSKSVSDFLSAIERLPELHQRLSNVIVTNKNGIDLIDKYNTENVFLYLDPPYVHSTRGDARYLVDMEDSDHEIMIDSCIKSKAKIMISGYDCELYDRLLDNGFKKIHFDVNTITGNRKPKTKTETLWINY